MCDKFVHLNPKFRPDHLGGADGNELDGKSALRESEVMSNIVVSDRMLQIQQGAYYSFVHFLSWILSGAAFAD